jgi:hypothetical protein
MIREFLSALILAASSLAMPGVAVKRSAPPALEYMAQDSAAPAKPAVVAKPIATLSWLLGGVWTADASKLAPGMLRIETRYQWADNNAYIRFNTHFVFDKGSQHNYDGNFRVR